jgi:tRNA (mo5U34)-methyltransferase
MSNSSLQTFDDIAKMILDLPEMESKTFIVDKHELTIGDPDELTEDQMATFKKCIHALKPWKKGPLNLFGERIDTEWRSDLKWERLQAAIPSLKDKVICDLGCGNGYFMYRMLEYLPKLVVGVDPNLHAWLEFNLFQRIRGVDNLKFEYMRGDIMASLPGMFDVVFCLGVLYHTPDPITMLKDIHKSMKGKSTLIVDCQGIPGEDHIALFPQKRYTNMKGVYFLPTLNTLKNWLQRANFRNLEVVYSEELSTEEQRTTEWAPVKSLGESLDPTDDSKTIEGYPRAHRFYVKCMK